MEKFHEFHAELQSVRERLKDPAAAADGRAALAACLDRQESETQRDFGQSGAELYGRAKYAMAALADEVLLGEHKETWMPQLLEAALFRSQCAGDKIFTEVDAMAQPAPGSAAAELARVYLAVLGLGFQGRYRHDADADRKIKAYRQKLFRLAYDGDPLAAGSGRRIAPDAYGSTLTGADGGALPSLWPWIWAMLVVVLLYAAAGAVVWQAFAGGLDPKIDAINTRSVP